MTYAVSDWALKANYLSVIIIAIKNDLIASAEDDCRMTAEQIVIFIIIVTRLASCFELTVTGEYETIS